MNVSQILSIYENSQIGDARRLAQQRADALGFDETDRGRVAIVVSELGHNLLKHAGGGELIFQDVEWKGQRGFEVLSLDRGPGMPDLAACLRDGYSTTGTQGTGLGALSRMANEFELYTGLDEGVILLARVWDRKSFEGRWSVRVPRAICLSFPGEEVSGDAWAALRDEEVSLYMVADGLGHGPEAAKASQEAVHLLEEFRSRSVRDLLEIMHQGLKKTRGAALAVACIEHQASRLTYAGIGNIAGKLFGPHGVQGLISHDGTAGYLHPKMQTYSYPWESESILVMHSDGLSTRTVPNINLHIKAFDASVIAAYFLRESKRARDDQTILVVKGQDL